MSTLPNPDGLPPETQAFLEAQPVYDAVLEKAESAGAPPPVLNALTNSGEQVLEGLRLLPMTLGAHLLLVATGNAYLAPDAPVTVRDNLVLLLAMTEPEWADGKVWWDADGEPSFSRAELAERLALMNGIPARVMPAVVRHFIRQQRIMHGAVSSEPEDTRPLDVTAAMARLSPPLVPAPVTPDGSGSSTSA